MDGLAAGVVLIAFGSLTASFIALGSWTNAVLVVAVVGATVAFLRYNFNPARIFMGDSGSMFLGYMLAVYCILGAGRAQSVLAIMIPVIALGLPLADTVLAVVRRLLARRSLFQADRDHIHHRASRTLKLSHRDTVIFLYAISIGFGVAATLLAISRRALAHDLFSIAVLVVTAVGIYLLLWKLGYISLMRNPRNIDGSTESIATPEENEDRVRQKDEDSSESTWSSIDGIGEPAVAETANPK